MSLIPKIEIKEDTGSDSFDYEAVFESCFVNLDEEILPPQTIMGIGTNTYKGKEYVNSTFTRGEMSAIVAPKKSKKTFLKTSLCASYIGGQANAYFPSIITRRKEDLYVFDFDTEQGEFYSQTAMRRVSEMVGSSYDNYMPFSLKKISKKDRLKFIDCIVKDPRYKNKIGIIFIDGIVDLCENPNDINKAGEVIEKLMEWNEGTHICCLIHKTFGLEKARGHLGTIIQEKCETTIFLNVTDPETKNSPVEVRQEDSRGAPFDTFHFDLDTDNVLPRECDFGTKNW